MATATATAKKTKIKFRPMDDRVLLEVVEADETTAGGIILPDAAREKPQRAVVVASGPGKLLDSGSRGEMSVRVGDEVFYGKYSGTEVELNDDTFVVLRESDIHAAYADRWESNRIHEDFAGDIAVELEGQAFPEHYGRMQHGSMATGGTAIIVRQYDAALTRRMLENAGGSPVENTVGVWTVFRTLTWTAPATPVNP